MDEIDLLKGFRDDMPEPTTDAWVRARAAISAAGGEAKAKAKAKGTTRARFFRPLYAATLAAVAAVAAITGALLSESPTPASTGGTMDVVRAMVAAAISNEAGSIVVTQSETVLANGTTSTGEWWDDPWTAQPGDTVQQVGRDFEGGNLTRSWYLSFVVPQSDRISPGDDYQLGQHGTTVDYTDHTWSAAPPPSVTLPPGLDMLASSMRLIGNPTVGSQKTIELQSISPTVTFTLWINATDSLPLQSETIGKGYTEQEQYQFQPPTASNLKRFSPSVPTGFTESRAQGVAS
jgi:hypothetical protein